MFKHFIKPVLQYTHVENISKILEKEPDILFAYLFGSHAKNTVHKKSDMDIAVYLKDPILRSRPALPLKTRNKD